MFNIHLFKKNKNFSQSVHCFVFGISDGPDKPMIKVMPEKSVYMSGSEITLSCSADSSPSATVQWMFNGTYLNKNSQQLKLENVSSNNSGVYECIVHNSVTLRHNSGSVGVNIMGTFSP